MLSKVLPNAIILTAISASAMTFAAPAEAKGDPLIGKTYSEAQGLISNWHGTLVVASIVGDVQDRDKCTVASWRKTKPLDGSGKPSGPSSYLLNLNCNMLLADSGSPGASAGSPEGRNRKGIEKKAAHLNKDQSWCYESKKQYDNCVNFCAKYDDLCHFTLS